MAHCEQIAKVLGAKANGDHPSVRQRLDETLAFEDMERAPNRPSADGQLDGELVLDERRSGREDAVDDRLAQRTSDAARIDAPRELDGVLAGASRISQRMTENS